MTYTFGAQKARGDAGEQFLDRWFATTCTCGAGTGDYEIRPATRDEQRQGIDRIFTHRQSGRRLAVEYKTDYRASETGNAFVETISVDSAGKAGWAYSSQADYLMYYIPGDDLIYVLALETLRQQLPRWLEEYPLRAAQNTYACTTGAGDGYATHGVLVPLHKFEEHAEAVINT